MRKTVGGDFPTNQTCCYIPHSLSMDDSSYGKHKENELLSWYLKFCSSRINLKFARICLNVYAEVNWIFSNKIFVTNLLSVVSYSISPGPCTKTLQIIIFLKKEREIERERYVCIIHQSQEVYFAMGCICFLLSVAGILLTQNTAKIISLHRNTAACACNLPVTVLKWAHPHNVSRVSLYKTAPRSQRLSLTLEMRLSDRAHAQHAGGRGVNTKHSDKHWILTWICVIYSTSHFIIQLYYLI